MSNEATKLGITAVNKARQAQVEADAQKLINEILGHQRSIKSYNDSTAEEQKLLAAIANDVVDQKTVIGTEWTPPLNDNQVTILTGIKKINDARQEQVSVKSQGHTNRILANKAMVETLNKSIAEAREKLAKLSLDVVTIPQIVG